MMVVYDVSEHSSFPAPSETKPPSPVTSSKSASAPTQAGPESAVKINVYCDLKTSLRYTDMCSDNNTTFL